MTGTTEPLTSIEIVEWDAKLPIGDWVGPDPVPLFPPKGAFPPVSQEDRLDFRTRSIELAPSPAQQTQIKDWVLKNIPCDMQRFCFGLEPNIPHLPKTFYTASPPEDDPEDECAHDHEENRRNEWQTNFDGVRIKFTEYLQSIDCRFRLSSIEELADNRQVSVQQRESPVFFQAPRQRIATKQLFEATMVLP